MTILREGIAEMAQERQRRDTITWRCDHNLTQAQAAHWVGVSRRQWIRYEVGDRPVPKWLRIIVGVVPATLALQRLNEREG